jgi:hypothetical protein
MADGGEWSNDRTYGVQFRARFLKAMPPTTEEGIEKYLGSYGFMLLPGTTSSGFAMKLSSFPVSHTKSAPFIALE